MKSRMRIGILILAVVLSATGYAAYHYWIARTTKEATDQTKRSGRPPVPVVTTEVQLRRFEDVIRVQGTLKSKNFALVSPRIPGVLEEVLVREGQEVVANQTRLFRTDNLKLEKAVEMNRQALNVARCAREEKEAYAERIDAELRKAEQDHTRYKNLLDKKVISSDAYEEKLLACEQLRAMRKHAQSLIALSREEERRAGTALSMAEKDLRDSVVLAPISGKVTRRMAEPGEMGTPGVPVVSIDDAHALEASTHLPSQFYARVEPGATRVRMAIGNAEPSEFAVAYKSSTIDATLRTFEIKCDVPGDSQRAVPGALVEMTVVLLEKRGLGVPTEAIQQRTGRKVVFLIKGDIARIAVVETGLETDGWIEVSGDALSEKAAVVTQGQFLLNDGSIISVPRRGE